MTNQDNIELEFAQDLAKSGLTDIGGSLVRSNTEIFLGKFLTQDKELSEVKEKVRKLAPTKLPVLILGESGVGKELLATALHGQRQGRLVAINAGGIPDTLLEAEFFGAQRGAFTGCDRDRPGLLEDANEGTLFLDEIGEMPLMLQCKLLRVIQEKKARRLGSTKEYKITCRFVSATNLPLEDIQNNKIFRRDLFYRLAGSIIYVKPLRERLEDIDIICEHFKVNKWDLDLNVSKLDGNVRQLLNSIAEYMVLNKK